MNATRTKRRRFIPMPELTDELLAVMDANSLVEDSGCIVWTGAKSRGYGNIKVSDAVMFTHRISFYRSTGVDPKEFNVDHMCFNPACLNPAHLRLVTNKQNQENRSGASKKNLSGFRGVSWHKGKSKWQVCIKHNGVGKHLGYFPTAAEAGAFAESARISLFTHNDLDRNATNREEQR